VAALAFLLLGKTFLKHKPVALFVVIAGIVAARTLHLETRGVALLGTVPQGVPWPALPDVSRADFREILPLAMACFVLAAVETTAIGRMFGAKHGYRIDATQEFLAIGTANLAAGLGRAFPVSGGMSQSLVNESSGARTPLSGLVASLVTLVVILFFTGLLSALPQPVLAAIVLVAVTGLIQVEALKHIWRFSRQEFAVAVVALFGVLGSGLLNGVLFGAVLSIVLLLGRASRPRVVEIGRVPGTSYFADLVRHPENERVPQVLVVRVEGALLYFNTDHVRDRLMAMVSRQATPPGLIVLFMGTSPYIDLAGTEMLIELQRSCRGSGMTLRLAEAHSQVREALQRIGHEQASALVDTHATVDAVIAAWRESSGRGWAAAS
jgi:MFS superfamily sulfate permease-like transporter